MGDIAVDEPQVISKLVVGCPDLNREPIARSILRKNLGFTEITAFQVAE